MKKITIFTAISLFSVHTYAMFCPTNFSQIYEGATIDQVVQQCGKPDKITKKQLVEGNQPQEWAFYVKPDPTQPNNLKMTVAFDAGLKVINITVNGTSLIATTICGNNIQVGDTAETVKTACGQPAFKNQSAESGANVNISEITEYSYNSNPPVTLLFKDGKLTGSK